MSFGSRGLGNKEGYKCSFLLVAERSTLQELRREEQMFSKTCSHFIPVRDGQQNCWLMENNYRLSRSRLLAQTYQQYQ